MRSAWPDVECFDWSSLDNRSPVFSMSNVGDLINQVK